MERLDTAPKLRRTCSVDGCDRVHYARGVCSVHYESPNKCRIEDCGKPVTAHRLCAMHLRRYKLYGDPLVRLQIQGEGSINGDGYRSRTRRHHPLARANGMVFEHRLVLFESLGGQDAPCFECGRSLRWHADPKDKDFLAVDHIDCDKLNNRPENLRPSCIPCNVSRARQMTIDRFN